MEEKGKVTLLSIPKRISINRKERRRAISVAISKTSDCWWNCAHRMFCIYPHVKGLSGKGAYEYVIDREFQTLRRQIDLNESQISVLKSSTTINCWKGSALCKPSDWFINSGSTLPPIVGKEAYRPRDYDRYANGVFSIEIPKDKAYAPAGKWEIVVDICEYKPKCLEKDGTICKQWSYCSPHLCRKNVVDVCNSSRNEDCYSWFASEEFTLQIIDD